LDTITTLQPGDDVRTGGVDQGPRRDLRRCVHEQLAMTQIQHVALGGLPGPSDQHQLLDDVLESQHERQRRADMADAHNGNFHSTSGKTHGFTGAVSSIHAGIPAQDGQTMCHP
jgi:hypothetical protein